MDIRGLYLLYFGGAVITNICPYSNSLIIATWRGHLGKFHPTQGEIGIVDAPLKLEKWGHL